MEKLISSKVAQDVLQNYPLLVNSIGKPNNSDDHDGKQIQTRGHEIGTDLVGPERTFGVIFQNSIHFGLCISALEVQNFDRLSSDFVQTQISLIA